MREEEKKGGKERMRILKSRFKLKFRIVCRCGGEFGDFQKLGFVAS